MRPASRRLWPVLAIVLLVAACGDDTTFNPPTTSVPPSTTSVSPSTSSGSTEGEGESSSTTVTVLTDSTLTPTTSEAIPCSAWGMSALPQPELVESAYVAREAIIAAATTCDYQALAALADVPYFAWDLGIGGSPADYWRTQEEEHTGTPLRYLVETLNLPSGIAEADGYVSTIWPAADGAASWAEVDPAEQAALVALYGPAISEDWVEHGEFDHYRVAVGAEGDWFVFMTGS